MNSVLASWWLVAARFYNVHLFSDRQNPVRLPDGTTTIDLSRMAEVEPYCGTRLSTRLGFV